MNQPSDRLFNKNFTLFLAGQCVALLGSTLYNVVLVLYLKRITGSAAVIGFVELLAFLPWVLLGPLAGTLVDRTNRKTVIVWSYFLRGILMILLSLFSLNYFLGLKMVDIGIAQFHLPFSFPFTLYAVFCVTVCMGIIDSAFNAALYSIVPTILAKDKIQQGNSLIHGAGGVLAVAGNALGGIFFSVLGGALAFLLNGISYLCAAFASFFISFGQRAPGVKPASSYRSFISEVKEGILFIWANRGLRYQTIVYTLSNLLFPAVMIALPFLVEDVMKLGNAYYGYLLSTLTMSSIAGYLVFGMLKTTEKQNYAVICAVFIIEAVLFLFLSFTVNVFFVFGLLSLLSICMAISRLINTSIKQKVIPEELRGRVFGTLDSINGGLVPLSLALSGVLIDLLNKNILLIFFFIFILYSLLALVFVLNKPIRHFYLQKI
jgi:DHA3 family macrolide efflux protein-like MFS transporter